MPKLYSLDFKELVISKVLSGLSYRKAGSFFKIHYKTVESWIKQYKNKEDLSPKYKRGRHKPKKFTDQDLLDYIENNNDSTLLEIGNHFSVSDVAIHKRLKILNITRKKTTLYQERDEAKRSEFLNKLNQIDSSDIVYLDESGIDKYLHRDYARSVRGKKIFSDVKGIK